MSEDNPTLMPTNAITRLKESTQYARVLPIIGLSISSRGVEFLKHVKDRTVICVHPIKSIHCACQDQDLRYFAYVTREQRRLHGTSQSSGHQDHHYCHVFVVKNEAMSTEVMIDVNHSMANLCFRFFWPLDKPLIWPIDLINVWSTRRIFPSIKFDRWRPCLRPSILRRRLHRATNAKSSSNFSNTSPSCALSLFSSKSIRKRSPVVHTLYLPLHK